MSWHEARIGDLGRVITGKTPPRARPDYFGDEYPFVTPSDFGFMHYYCTDVAEGVSDLGFEKHKNQTVPRDAAMCVCIGNTIGKCAIASEPCLTNQQINSVIAGDNSDPKYIYYLLCNIREQIRAVGLGGGAAQPIINKTKFSNLRVTVPDLRTQRTIAATLSAYDDLIENNRRRIVLLEETARLLYREWFVHFRFPGHEHVKITDGLPGGWERTQASSVMDVLSGGTPRTATAMFWDGEIGFFTPKDATDTPYVLRTEKTITEEGLRACNSQLFPQETLFITARGTVGKLNLALAPMAMNQSCYGLRTKSHFGQKFLYLALSAAIEQVRSRATGAVFDAIIVATFDRIPFIVPPEALTRSFESSITPMFDQIANLIQQNQKLAQARDLLLPRLMNGEIAL